MEGEVSRGVQAHAGPHAQADLEDSAKPASLAPRPGRTPSRPQCTGPRALPPSSSPERPCRPATLTTLAGLLGVVPGLAAAGASLSAGFWTLPTQGPPHRRDIRAPRPSTPLASLWPKQQCPLPPLPIGRLRHREVTGLALDLHPLSETSLQAIPSGPSWHRPPPPASRCLWSCLWNEGPDMKQDWAASGGAGGRAPRARTGVAAKSLRALLSTPPQSPCKGPAAACVPCLPRTGHVETCDPTGNEDRCGFAA